jgi:O-antigen/teichoic acid export membrane protein
VPDPPATPADADAAGSSPIEPVANADPGSPLGPTVMEPPPAGRSLARSMSALLGAQIVTWVMSTAVMVVVPRVVGPESIGHYQLAVSIWAVGLTTISLGTNTLVTLEIARDQRASSFELGPALVARLVAYAAAWVPLGAFVLIAGYGSEVITLFVIVGVVTLATSVAELARASLIGFEHFGAIARADIATKVALAVLMITAAVVTEDVRVVAITAIVPTTLSTIMLFRDLHRSGRITYGRSRRAAWGAVKRSSSYLSIGVALVLYMQLDVVLMSFFVSDVEIGWYGQADSLFATLLFVPTIMMTSLLPRQAREHAENPESTQATLEQGFRTLMLLAVPIGLGVVLVAHEVVDLLYGNEFFGTGPVLAVYGVVLMIMFETILLGQHAISIGRQNFWLVLMILGVVMTLPLDIVFIPWTEDRYDNGAIGGALSYVVTEVMMLVAALWKLAPGLVSKRTLVRLVKTLVAGGAMFAACWPLSERSLPLTVLVGAVVYPAALVATRPFDEPERNLLDRLVSTLPSRLRRA